MRKTRRNTVDRRFGSNRPAEELHRQLRERLARDLEAGNLRRWSSGKINREFYASQFGLVRFTSETVRKVIVPFENEHSDDHSTGEGLVEMREWLTGHFQAGTLEIYRSSGRIVRKSFAVAFGLVYDRFERRMPGVAALLAEFDKKVVDDEYQPNELALALAKRQPMKVRVRRNKKRGNNTKNVEARLTALLAVDFAAGTVKVGNGGKISRTHYAKILGVSTAAVSFYAELLDSYERKLGGRRAVKEHKLVEMEQWLITQMEARTLQIHLGRVSRRQFACAFEMSTISKRRHPLITELLVRYDTRVAKDNYSPSTDPLPKSARLEILRQALNDPPLRAPGLAVSVRSLIKATGLSPHMFKTAPFKAAIEKANERLRSNVDAEPLNFRMGGFPYLFKPLVDAGLPRPFVSALKKVFQDWVPKIPRKRQHETYYESCRFFEFVAKSGKKMFGVRSQSSIVDVRLWNDVRVHYRGGLLERGETTANRVISILNALQAKLSGKGVVPEVKIPLRHYAVGERGHLRTLIEAPPIGKPATATVPSQADRYIDFVESFIAASDMRLSELKEEGDRYDFVDTIRLQIEQRRNPLPSDPRAAVELILDERLNAADQVAQTKVIRWRTHFEHGQRLLQLASEMPDIDHQLADINRKGHKSKHRHLITSLNGRDAGLGNLLLLVQRFHNLLMPSKAGHSFISTVSREYGTFEELQAYLVPHRDAVVGTILSYYCTGGSNSAVGRTLPRNYKNGVRRGLLDVEGIKDKASGAEIHVETPLDSFLATSLEWLHGALLDTCELASPAERNMLFLVAVRHRIKLISDYHLRASIRRMCLESDTLAGLNIVPSMLRTSKILVENIRNNGEIKFGQAFGQHTEGTSLTSYQNKIVNKFIRDADVRSLQIDMESLTIEEDRQILILLNITEEAFAERPRRIRRTGMGTLCDGSEDCQSFECWTCPDILVVADPRLIALMQCWQISLIAAKPVWETERPERWSGFWLKWLKLIADVEKKMSRGSDFVAAWNEGTHLREQLQRDPGFKLPQPW